MRQQFKMNDELFLSILHGPHFMEKGYKSSELNLDFNQHPVLILTIWWQNNAVPSHPSRNTKDAHILMPRTCVLFYVCGSGKLRFQWSLRLRGILPYNREMMLHYLAGTNVIQVSLKVAVGMEEGVMVTQCEKDLTHCCWLWRWRKEP